MELRAKGFEISKNLLFLYLLFSIWQRLEMLKIVSNVYRNDIIKKWLLADEMIWLYGLFLLCCLFFEYGFIGFLIEKDGWKFVDEMIKC